MLSSILKMCGIDRFSLYVRGVSSYLLILVLFKRSLFCINALLGASWQLHVLHMVRRVICHNVCAIDPCDKICAIETFEDFNF